MFDLERELEKWRREIAAAGLNSPDIVRELEEHLREDIEQQIRSGTGAREAFQAAIQRIGQPGVLKNEFDIIRQTGVRETLRRHKWKVLLCTGAGVLAAIIVHFIRPLSYQSEAKLFLRSPALTIQQVGPIPPPGNEERKKIIDEALGILGSLDFAQQVAESFGPEGILSKAGGDADSIRAAALVRDGLTARVYPKSNVVHLAFRHPDPAVVQPVLREIINRFSRNGSLALGAGQITTVAQIQSPSRPFDLGASYRILASIVAAGVLAGLAWVLVVRWYSDRAERRLPGIG